ncbi:MAG: type IV pilus modification PilV family protein [Thiobacillus sp.]
MQKASLHTKESGFSLAEVLMAVAIFALFATAIVGGLIYGRESTQLAGTRQRAVKLADECQEAVRGIRDGNYSNLTNGTFGLLLSGGHWTLSGSSDVTDIFTRSVNIADGVANQKVITCNVTWTQNLQRTGNIQTVSYLTNWMATVSSKRGGMLVYGDGGTTSDAIKYQTYDDNTGTWSVAAATADIDTGTTNKYLRAVRLYSKPGSSEKVMVSRHYDGTRQYIYAQVWNGSSWGNVQHLTSATNGWAATTYLDVQNFDGAYLNNGSFVVVYNDNSSPSIPKSYMWNGATWQAQANLASLGTNQIPTTIELAQRPGTNEIMAAFFTTALDTWTQYYNGSAWSLNPTTAHATSSPLATKKMVDFVWSSIDSTKGVLIYATATNDKAITARTWTANGTGGGAWGTAFKYGTTQTSNLGALYLSAIPGTANFIACDKDATATPLVICSRLSTTAWVAASNITVVAATDTGIQQSSTLAFEGSTPTYGVMIYSDNTTTAKLKKFNIATNTWDGSATPVNSTAVGVIKTARNIVNPTNSDQMLFVTDANLDLYSILWDGTRHQLYSTLSNPPDPPGKLWTTHGVSGSAAADYWYDFAWDGQ